MRFFRKCFNAIGIKMIFFANFIQLDISVGCGRFGGLDAYRHQIFIFFSDTVSCVHCFLKFSMPHNNMISRENAHNRIRIGNIQKSANDSDGRCSIFPGGFHNHVFWFDSGYVINNGIMEIFAGDNINIGYFLNFLEPINRHLQHGLVADDIE